VTVAYTWGTEEAERRLPFVCDNYLAHPDEARDIGERARKRALAEHTLRHRIETMLAVLKG